MSTLDRLVAEKVMGWQFWLEQRGEYQYVVVSRDGREPWTERHPDAWKKDSQRYTKIAASDFNERKHILCFDWSPSTDMNAAMEVADILINRGWTFFLEYAKGRFWCLLSQGSWADVARWSLISREHTNPATAICLAALAAVGVEYKEQA